MTGLPPEAEDTETCPACGPGARVPASPSPAPPPPVEGLFRRILSRASAVDRLNAAFVALVAALTLVAFGRTPHRWSAMAAFLGLYLALYVLGKIRASGLHPARKQAVMFVATVLFLFGAFESLVLVMPWFREVRLDRALSEVDLGLFGVNPTVWCERFARPWLTDLMYVLYFFYFPMPLFVLVPMLVKGRYEALEKWFFTFLSCYFGAYALYFVFPAEGPRFHLASEHAGPLSGVFLARPIHGLIDALEPNKLDAFPSLHAAILVVTMRLAWEQSRRLFYVYVPVAAGILFSLVYLRYHYVVDVIAGIVWAAIAVPVAGRIWPRIRARSAPHFGTPP